MIDLKIIRDDPERIKAEVKARGIDLDVALLVKTDEKRRKLQTEIDQLRAEQKQIRDAKQGKAHKEKIRELETHFQKTEIAFNELYKKVPNFSTPDVPPGKNENDNQVIRTVGQPPKIANPKSHWEIGQYLEVIDSERAAKVSGARFTFLKGRLVLLQFALINYALSVLTDQQKLGAIAKAAKLKVPNTPFIPVIPPAMLRRDALEKMARTEPREDRYYFEKDDLFLAGSAEHTIGAMHMDETFAEADLPRRYVGYSTSFRREAGTYGKDTRGILRLHQFDKLEMESFTVAENSLLEQNFLVAIQEHLVGSLGLAYQVVAICRGDMGDPDARQIDIETWMPGQNKYRETHTADLMTDYQSRRLKTKVKRAQNTEFAHMNDATAVTGRIIAAIVENYQDKDGNVDMPEVLHPYLPFTRIEKE